jgi:hypothetical protein
LLQRLALWSLRLGAIQNDARQTPVIPANRWVFIDQHPDSIAHGWFQTLPVGFVDFPSTLHNHGVTLDFADGHSEFKRWKLAETYWPVTFSYSSFFPAVKQDDVRWLFDRTGEIAK